MSENELAGATPLVSGASRGFGQGIATALSGAGVLAAASPGVPEPVLTPDQVGKVVTDLVTGDDDGQTAYMVTPAGLRPLP
jgi:NAD(P)-dependent dehydrogenase (short-subunit alcohol dehydrogenase family)